VTIAEGSSKAAGGKSKKKGKDSKMGATET